MLRQSLFLLLSLSLSSVISSQEYSIKGRVTNNRMEPLALASIQVNDQRHGTITSESGEFLLRLEAGEYTLVITMIGYTSQVMPVILDRNMQLNVILEPDDRSSLGEVIVKGKIRDRAEEIIRQVIRGKNEILAAPGSYSTNVYIRATQEDSGFRIKKKRKQVADTTRSKPDASLQRMSMAEISLRYDQSPSGAIKEERTGVVKRGNSESLLYLSVTEADFNLYHNLLRAPALSQVPFISPISYSGLAAYRFRTVSTRWENGKKIYTISVKPRQLSNVTIDGEITVMDSSWVILTARFRLPSYHVPEYDAVDIEQRYDHIENKAWMIGRQVFTYYAKHGKAKLSGQTIATYQGFELNKNFGAKYFGNEVSVTAQAAYERDTLFWQQIRTEPLTTKELRFIRYRDSIHRVTNSKPYLDSLDRLTNKVTWKKIALTGQTIYNREKERTWSLPPLFSAYQPFQFGGVRLSFFLHYHKRYKSRKFISVASNLSYGIRNKDVNGSITFSRLYNPFNRGFYRVELRRDFQYIFSGDAWINMIKRNNIYLDNSVGISHGLELFNGLFLETGAEMAFRRSVSHYKTNDRVDSLFGDILDDNKAVEFSPYNALYGRVRLSYTPAQRYIREPREKIILGSKWPTFYTELKKGVDGVFRSTIDFEYLEFGIEQQLKLGTVGVSRYNIKSGSFLSKRDLRLVDYKFQRRGDPLLFLNPHEAFQSLDSTFPVFKRFYQGHWVHELNGAVLNKIPFLKKLQLREIAGAGFLVAPERNLRYGEIFTGIERVFRFPFNPLIKFKLGAYVVGSASNQFRNPVQFKIGITSWDRLRNRWF